jgi:1-acyl-sn-glycerol-3-phosphate acyltransferase
MNILLSFLVWLIVIVYMTVTFPVTFLIWLIALPFDPERKMMHWMLIYEGTFLTRLIPIWNIRIEGREKAVRGETYVIISNHQSMLDIVIINCLLYRFKWISKIENMKVPFIGWYLRMADYITVDRGNSESKDRMMERSFETLARGTSIMMFPEGTRSPDGEIGFFKRGAFQLALGTKKPILPVVIDGTGGILPKHGLVFSSGHKIKIRVLDPVMPASFETEDPDALAASFNTFMTEALKALRNENPGADA